MKRISVFLLLVILSLSVLSASAFLDDRAGLLTDEERAEVEEKLSSSSLSSGLSMVIVTDISTYGKSEMAYADDYYDQYVGDVDGVLLFLDVGGRSVYISTVGYGRYAVDDSGEEIVFDAMMPSLQKGDWFEAFMIFSSVVEELTKEYTYSSYEEVDYDINTGRFSPRKEEKGFDWAIVVFSFLILGVPGGFIVSAILKKQLKSEKLMSDAEDYVKPSSFALDYSNDIFLYSTISKVPRPQNNGGSGPSRSSHGHISSSGVVHGGGGRKF